jgi:hypothetical protein
MCLIAGPLMPGFIFIQAGRRNQFKYYGAQEFVAQILPQMKKKGTFSDPLVRFLMFNEDHVDRFD